MDTNGFNIFIDKNFTENLLKTSVDFLIIDAVSQNDEQAKDLKALHKIFGKYGVPFDKALSIMTDLGEYFSKQKNKGE